jgi:hypothetical protein
MFKKKASKIQDVQIITRLRRSFAQGYGTAKRGFGGQADIQM